MAVLIVDDVRVNRLTLGRALAPIPCFEAADVAEAMQKFFEEKPKVVLLDLGLPEIDGVILLRIIRMYDERNGCRTPVIVVTGEGTPERVREVMDLDIQGFFVKPIDSAALVQKVKECWPGANAP